MGCFTQKKAGSTLFDDRSEDRGHPAGLVDGRLHPKVVLCPTCARFVGLISTRSRNIQTQLSILLPENAKEWRRYRPNGINKGKDRLTALKNCREYQNSKRLRHTPQPKAKLKKADMTAFGLKQVQVANPFYDPGRHYDSIHCKGVPSHSTFPTLNQSFWNQSPSRSSSGSDSDKEVVCAVSTDTPNEGRTTSDMLDSRYYSQCDSKAPTPTAREPVSNNGIADTDSSQSESHSDPRRDDEVVPLVVKVGTPPAFNTTSITRSSSRASRSGGASIRTISTRISSRASISWSHVSSVLAATLSSGFSHRYSASSSFADLSRLDNTSTLWSRDEFESWNELVDQTRLHSAPLQLSSHAGSLHERPCCGRFKEIPYTQTIEKCNVCGYNGIFQLARHVKIRLFDSGTQDRFGNTALHHAMAAGNLWVIKVWMDDTEHSSNVDLSHRNTSGETFLHVCRIQKSEQFITYTEILKTVAQRGFDFSIRDHSGRTIAQRLHELTDEWDKIDENQLLEAGTIFRMKNQLLEAGTIFRMKKNPNVIDLQGDEWQLPHSLVLPPPIERGTLLLNRLRQSPPTPIRGFELQSLVQHSDIHIRDERGYTALASAARLGFTDACDLLLQNGANPNTRSYQGTSVIAHVTAHLIQAQQNDDSGLYSRILSCIVQLTDHGAKLIVSDHDEFAIDALKEVKRKTSIRDKFLKPLLKSTSIMMRKNKRKLGMIEEKPLELEGIAGVSELEGTDRVSELGGYQIHKLDTYRPSVLADTSRIPEPEATSSWSVRTGTLTDQSSLNCVNSFKPPDSSQRIDPSAGDDCSFSIYAQPATSSWHTRQTGVQHSQCDGPAEFRCQPVIIDGYLSHHQPVSLSKSLEHVQYGQDASESVVTDPNPAGGCPTSDNTQVGTASTMVPFSFSVRESQITLGFQEVAEALFPSTALPHTDSAPATSSQCKVLTAGALSMTDCKGLGAFLPSPDIGTPSNSQPSWRDIGDNYPDVDPREEKSYLTSGHCASQLCGIEPSFSKFQQQLQQPVIDASAKTATQIGPDSCVSRLRAVPPFAPEADSCFTSQFEIQASSVTWGVPPASQDNHNSSKVFENEITYHPRKRRRRSGPAATEPVLKAYSVPSQTQLLSVEISHSPFDDIPSSTMDFAKPNNRRLIKNRSLMTTAMPFPPGSPEPPRKRHRRKGDYVKPGMASDSTGIPSPRFTNSFGQPAEAQLPGTGSQAPVLFQHR
ncbi:uncharacterized protein K444DRAFT_632391 [Hyaloscypha bicolor E]|uniref:Ankyrin n=1 Tax=Hyaloscypha bicolor E TaxID=1095630 RepID=A0A2J6T2M6_9HELO|nr:uncharacterized protein K444DRAFT_632391 [Hyaloscypha bicolor E]PMD57272.1 hypothetical protein K444DRAFT_632391 [Hyaloscypha bicolor E]